MADFLEERFSDLVRYGSSWQDEFAVRVIPVSGGNEYRSLVHPYPVRSFDVSYLLDSARTWSELLNVWQRAHARKAPRLPSISRWPWCRPASISYASSMAPTRRPAPPAMRAGR